MVLREAGSAVAGALFVVLAVVNCWAVQDSDVTPAPTAPISADERNLARAIARDALLDDGDIPGRLPPRAIGVEEANAVTLQSYEQNGWLLFVSNAWIGSAQDVYLVSQAVYVFEDQSRAADFIDEPGSEIAGLPDARPIGGLPDGAVGHERTFTRAGENERRAVEMAATVGRLVVSVDIELSAARADWHELSIALLEVATQRARDALAAAGE